MWLHQVRAWFMRGMGRHRRRATAMSSHPQRPGHAKGDAPNNLSHDREHRGAPLCSLPPFYPQLAIRNMTGGNPSYRSRSGGAKFDTVQPKRKETATKKGLRGTPDDIRA